MTARSATRALLAQVPNTLTFSPFGRVVTLNSGELPELVLTQGDGWSDAYTRDPLTRENPHLGMTSVPGAPFISTTMERHANVQEALLPASDAIVLAVAQDSGAAAPDIADVQAFLIPPGMAVVLDRGVWHDACRGAEGPTTYYWLSSCNDAGSSPWTPISGGTVHIRVTG